MDLVFITLGLVVVILIGLAAVSVFVDALIRGEDE